VTDLDRSAAARAGAALVRAERRRVARDLHRTPIQLLAAASLRMQLVVAENGEPSTLGIAAREIDAAISALRETMERLASSEIEPDVLADALALVDPGATPEPGENRVSIDSAAALLAGASYGVATPAQRPATTSTLGGVVRGLGRRDGAQQSSAL
jgi:signal transduction histidine kinase